MPNWVTNIVTIQSDDKELIEKIKNFVRGEQEEIENGKKIKVINNFDLKKIIPMPKEYEEEDRIGMELFHIKPGNEKKEKKLEKEREKLREKLEKEHGAPDWYEWSIKNWGTKWNTNGASEYKDGFEFMTAWSTPYPIFIELSRKFPQAKFKVQYADEDIGYNCGMFIMQDGEEIADYTPEEGTEEADRMSCDINCYDYDEYLEDCKA